jgi:hypothetical protein
MDNQYVIALAFWPAIVLLCAGSNMLLTWTFSWSELIFDYFIGVVAGWFLFAGTQAHPDGATSFFFVFSHGFFAVLWWAVDSFRTSFSKPETFFWTLAVIRIGATLWCAAWDHLSVKLGARLAPGPFFFSLFILTPVKVCFAWITGGIGFLIWVAGVVWAIGTNTEARKNAGDTMGKAGVAGGVFFTEFAPGPSSPYATTLGFTMHTWYGNTPFEHELYHTRQYIYMCDWLIPAWCVGILWGIISAAIAKGFNVSYHLAVGADASKEVGNPIEVAAYHI